MGGRVFRPLLLDRLAVEIREMGNRGVSSLAAVKGTALTEQSNLAPEFSPGCGPRREEGLTFRNCWGLR